MKIGMVTKGDRDKVKRRERQGRCGAGDERQEPAPPAPQQDDGIGQSAHAGPEEDGIGSGPGVGYRALGRQVPVAVLGTAPGAMVLGVGASSTGTRRILRRRMRRWSASRMTTS